MKVTARKSIYSKEMSILIPAASIKLGQERFGPTSLIQLASGQTLLEYQIGLLRKYFYNAEIILIAGFGLDRIEVGFPTNVRLIENENYLTSGVSSSILKGMRASIYDSFLILYGDLFFEESLLTAFKDLGNKDNSVAIVGSGDGVGCIGDEETSRYVEHFYYGLTCPWSQIIYLTGNETDLFKTIARKKENVPLLGHEVLNKVIEQGGKIEMIKQEKRVLYNVDSVANVRRLKGETV